MKQYTSLFFSIVVIFMVSLTMLANTSLETMGQTVAYIFVVVLVLGIANVVAFRKRIRPR